MSRRLLTSGAMAGLVAAGSILPTVWATPDFDVPFPCGQTWIGATRTSHNPPNGLDLNRSGDAGDVVVASASGTVTFAGGAGGSYGRHVVIDHGHGWETVRPPRGGHGRSGPARDRGDGHRDGGDSGVATGAHLHFEQRFRGQRRRASCSTPAKRRRLACGSTAAQAADSRRVDRRHPLLRSRRAWWRAVAEGTPAEVVAVVWEPPAVEVRDRRARSRSG